MLKKIIFGSLLIASCLNVIDVEASYIEAIREKYADKNVYAEYEICVVRQGIKKYIYGRTSNNMYLKHGAIDNTTLNINEGKSKDDSSLNVSKEVKRVVNRINNIAKSLNSINGQSEKKYDLNVIKDDKIYFINTNLREGKWANIGDFEQSKVLYLKALNDTPDGIYYMNVIRDVVTSKKDRVSVKVVKTSKEDVYNKLYDCEEVLVQRLSEFGRPIGDEMICKLYFDNGDIVYFSPLRYVAGDSPYSKQKNYSIEYKYGNGLFKVLELTNNVQNENFDLISICKLEKFPLGW